MGFLLRSYQTDFEATDRDTRVLAIKMRVKASACLKFKHLLFIVEQPDARERRIEVPHHGR